MSAEKPISLAVCIPSFSCISQAFFMCTSSMLLRIRKDHPDWNMTMILDARTYRHSARQALAERAMLWGADYILFMDDDNIVLEDDTFERLFQLQEKTNAGMACALYFARGIETEPCMYSFDRERDKNGVLIVGAKKSMHDFQHGKIYYPDYAGFGFVLIRRRVFQRISKPWFQLDGHFGTIGEDAAFCMRMKDVDEKLVVDPDIQVGHLSEARICIDENLWDLRRAGKLKEVFNCKGGVTLLG